MNFLKAAKAAFLNVFYYKAALLVLLMPTLIAPLEQYSYRILYIAAAWGGVLCAYDLFTKKRFLKTRGMLWLLAFLVIFGISVLINYKTAFSTNVASLIYTAVAVLLLYPDHSSSDKQQALKEMTALMNIFIGMTAVFSAVSLFMFASLYENLFNYAGGDNPIGWYGNRLYGIYKNPCYMNSAIGIALIVTQFITQKAREKRIKKPLVAFYVITFVLNFCSMCLENARGAFLSLAFFAAILSFLFMFRFLRRKGNNAAVAAILSLFCGAAAAGLVIGAVYCIRPILKFIPQLYALLTTGEKLDFALDIERHVDASYGTLTGRPAIWKFGIQEFLKKPVFGYGPQSHTDKAVVDIGIQHFHNLPIQCLVSVGILGTLPLLVYFFRFLADLVTYHRKNLSGDDKTVFAMIALTAVFGMFILNSMSEVTVLYLTRFSMFLYWIFTGYMHILADNNKKTKDDLLAEKTASFLDSIFTRKKKNAQ